MFAEKNQLMTLLKKCVLSYNLLSINVNEYAYWKNELMSLVQN